MANYSRTFTDRFRELGLGTKRIRTDRFLNKDGTFNVIKRGGGISGFSLYHLLIKMTWIRFFAFVTISYLVINAVFATLYLVIGAEGLSRPDGSVLSPFWHCFYFSCQTLTTVGYGHISPTTEWISLVAALEAMVGLLGFAFATGIMYGRFSKAKSKIIFSSEMLVSPYRGGKGLKFRIANVRDSQLIDMEARVMYSFIQNENNEMKRRYMQLDLELSFINLFPLPWTIVHALDENSPLFDKTTAQLKSENAEFLIIIKGYNDTFNQYVHQIHEYNSDEIIFNADFDQMFDPAAIDQTIVHLDKISQYHKINQS